ncbi:glycosyltransferase involved in cell wall biosynthesis [Dysgonomonadaceae bacterium PH5-43]|nr:glycosyltransferase involved in cell wall biosynthesis [Dysgonomonadaceae bacterium PH5-43]
MTFSVVICTYNRAKYLSKTLHSVLTQSISPNNFEIIVVDNNSTDNTSEVFSNIKENTSDDINLHYYKEINQGISHARNLGVSKAINDYIVFIDDDETIDSNFLEKLSDFLNIYPQAELISEPVVPVYETKEPEWLSPYTTALVTGAYNKGTKIKIVNKSEYPGTGHATFKRELFLKYGGFKTNLGRKAGSLMGGEDKDFFLRLMNNNIDCYYVPEAKIYHHIPASKLTEEYFNKLTFSIGKTEKIRTLNISKKEYMKRLFAETIKWGGTIVLFFLYLFKMEYPKGKKLVQFRFNVTKGLLFS